MSTVASIPRTSRVSIFVRGRSARRYAPLTSLLLVLPLFVTFAIGFLYPVAMLVDLSFSTGLAPYQRLVEESLYLDVLRTTVLTAGAVALLCLLLGYPVAYAMARRGGKAALITAACVLIPLWTSVLIRSYAWIVLLQRNGIVNTLLQASGLSDGPLTLLYTQGAVILAMTHVLLPFAILPIHSTLRMLPADLTRAAANLGAGPVRAFLSVTLPLSLPGVFAGAVLCFVLALGFYITPALVGGPGSMLMATLIGQQTTVVLDWPFAAALSTVLLAITLLIVLASQRVVALSKGFSNGH
ncbi:ABC transporter permease [Pseudorhizobium pelagicum]|uniref:ABC transporter permease n=1 Tax=Pseudorhizobium pelagicum TaxID=1509405 RepID=A0A922T8N4_9HYPH|nr:ABC transporter permease [Pseudorhizobium pelagicum]KEQ04788.1 ABC transporter permease [Pseudorhizobium pelagicum]KEQ07389.1 ABC transporter permease [Pseudorhizobium pelagicum]